MKVEAHEIVKRQKLNFEDSRLGIFKYDDDNIYPQNILRIIASSGIAQSSIRLARKYIVGRGFVDENLNKAKVNGKCTSFDLLRKIVNDDITFGEFAVQVNYNALFQKTELNYLPFEYCRLVVPDDNTCPPEKIKVSKYWDKSDLPRGVQIEKTITEYFLYNPDPEIIQAQVDSVGGWENYNGQVFYPNCYVKPLYDCVLEDVDTDGQTKTYRNNNIRTGFMASHILTLSNDLSDEESEEFDKNISEFQGADRACRILKLEGVNKDDINISKIDTNNNADMYRETESSVEDSIIQTFGQHKILLGIETPGKLGNSDLIFSQNFYNEYTQDDRQEFSERFKELTNGLIGFEKFTNFEIKTITGEEVSTTTLAEKIGVGGIQSVMAIISSTTMNYEQKYGSLQVLFGLTDEETIKILGKNVNTTI
jgi:hypothetical protein